LIEPGKPWHAGVMDRVPEPRVFVAKYTG
jgi:hypothetical protein